MLKLSASLLVFLLPFLSTILADSQFLQVLIREIDNPAGTLNDGKPSSNFGFLGVGNQNTWLKAEVTGGNPFTGSATPLQISSHGENKVSNINLLLEDPSPSTYTEFTGFKVSVKTAADQALTQLIDSYEIQVNTTDARGVYTYTHSREGTFPTTISIAWSTNISPPATTTVGTTVTSTVFTGTTPTPTSTLPPTTTPKLPIDCDEVADNNSSGQKMIYPDGVNGVQVYCEKKAYGSYTTIQSRTNNGEDNFNVSLAAYESAFGNAGPATNFWLGLENMNLVTSKKQYSLQIDLCCGGNLVSKQIYHNFKINDNSTGYTLAATPDVPGIGLAYVSTVTDIGAPFSVPGTYNIPPQKPGGCDELEYEDDDNNAVQPYGGWWYGSCGNNLNGKLIPSTELNGTCSNTNFAKNKLLGVNLRVDKNQAAGGFDVDLVSYDRVRMVLFTFDSLNVERNDDTFCKN